MPDMDAGSCNEGCGPPGFDSFTDVSSHELIEAITDPDERLVRRRLDTTRTNCGEIGDICAVGGTAEGATVAGFFVQNEWSNKNKNCIAVDPNLVSTTSRSRSSPTEVSVPAGGSATSTVTLTKTTGIAENVALTRADAADRLDGVVRAGVGDVGGRHVDADDHAPARR